jgi:hypothetical protein
MSNDRLGCGVRHNSRPKNVIFFHLPGVGKAHDAAGIRQTSSWNCCRVAARRAGAARHAATHRGTRCGRDGLEFVDGCFCHPPARTRLDRGRYHRCRVSLGRGKLQACERFHGGRVAINVAVTKCGDRLNAALDTESAWPVNMVIRNVIISSTGLDLRDYREAAEEICKRLHLFPVAMEYFEAMGLGATEGSKRKIDEADVYVGIYAHRYGYIEQGHDKSVTEIEFDYAGERNIERLCFVVDPKWPWPPDAWDYKNQEPLQRFKARLGASLIRSQFTTVDDLRVKLMQALVEWKGRHPGSDDVDHDEPPPPAALASLAPPTPPLFVGRGNDLTSLKARLGIGPGAARRAVTVIRGWPGVGKTTLVNALAHDSEVAAAFPDRVLWAAIGQTPNPIGELLAWARALGTVRRIS